ncbi:MAG: class I SAM-dependent methyltransferase [Phycisphaerales bacterium]|jgi:16S rRNA (guanine1516-N2)-methyltransferase|nr:class I SAM-dependent methyltransferase [Phycisphaerales bacterium]
MQNQSIHIEIDLKTTDPVRVAEADQIANKLPKVLPNSKPLYLSFLDTHTELRRPDAKLGNGYWVNFSAIDRRLGSGNLSKKQPLSKAIGAQNTSVVDVTAGFCKDAAILALSGYHVTAIERSPLVSVLLRDALRRAEEDVELWSAIGGRLKVVEGESKQILDHLENVDVVFLDPMFPDKRKKSALPPGHIQILSHIVGKDEDATELFRKAMQMQLNRVVVKRPNYAPPMQDQPVSVHKGKQVRYEVYKPTRKKTTQEGRF